MASSPPKRRRRLPILIDNLPSADDKVWKVTRNYDLYTSSLPSSSFKEDPNLDKKETAGMEARNAEAVYEAERLSVLPMTKYSAPASSKAPRDLAERLIENPIAPTRRNPRYIQQKLTARHANGMNGAVGAMNGASNLPIHAGQQMDLNYIYSKVLELSDQLKANREQTQGLIAGAEELAVGVSVC